MYNRIVWLPSQLLEENQNIAYKLANIQRKNETNGFFENICDAHQTLRQCFCLTDHVILMLNRLSTNPKWLPSEL